MAEWQTSLPPIKSGVKTTEEIALARNIRTACELITLMKKQTLLVVTMMFCGSLQSRSADVIFQSTAARTHLLELYTSEGCSSCPAAERWLSQLQRSPRLWKEIVPIAFHVDYWDGLGWPDRFASKAYTARQRSYAAAWGSGTVYTPGFVLDGREWLGRALESIPQPVAVTGVLSATIHNSKTVVINYQPGRPGKWEVHAALLGFGLESDVQAGENSGRKLLHDFVVLADEVKAMSVDAGAAHAEIVLPSVGDETDLGLAIWVTESGKLEPVQAMGGKLTE